MILSSGGPYPMGCDPQGGRTRGVNWLWLCLIATRFASYAHWLWYGWYITVPKSRKESIYNLKICEKVLQMGEFERKK